jgi:hypothetical protein
LPPQVLLSAPDEHPNKSSSFAVPCGDNLADGDSMKINRTQVIGVLLLAALLLLGLLLRYWKFSG